MSGGSPLPIRPVAVTEFPEFYRAILDAFGEDVRDSERDNDLAVFEPERSLAVFDGDQVVGTAGAYTRRLTVPGRTVPIAAVTLVSVAPTHRRRGLLTAMMRRQLTEVREAGREPIAALWASEGSIYGRFGYGLAARHATLTGQTHRMGLRPSTDLGTGRIRQVTPAELPALVGELYGRTAERRVGWLDRPGRWWRPVLFDPEHRRNGASGMRAVVHEGSDGHVDGYAVYQIRGDWQPSGPDGEVRVREILAATPQGYAALWQFILNLDLVRRVRAPLRPPDEPLQHLVTDPRSVELSLVDNLWVRVVDVGRALAARRYARDIDLVLDVGDEFCPWNAGRWRLTGGPDGAECTRAAGGSRAVDLVLTSTDLGAALLGGTSLAVLAAAGRVREARPGTLRAATTAFAADRQPWCPEVF